MKYANPSNTKALNYRPNIIVTGGAGYIGSHTAKKLHESGYLPVVFDNLVNGHREAVRWGPLIEGDIRDKSALLECFKKYRPAAVIHFAGLIEVGESMSKPKEYWDVNFFGTSCLVQAMIETNIPHIVLSSTAAVYGTPREHKAITEDSRLSPINVYGETKLAAERYVAAYCRAHGLSGTALRYFNAAGASKEAEIGEAHPKESHLIPLAIEAAMGINGRQLSLYGNDFDTGDGTCVRDFIHVEDLASAHVVALERDVNASRFRSYNLGTGIGTSVQEIIDKVSTHVSQVPYTVSTRRAGDPAYLVASPLRAVTELEWKPSHSDIDNIIKSAYEWRKNPKFGFKEKQTR